jgi:hypothetical protein
MPNEGIFGVMVFQQGVSRLGSSYGVTIFHQRAVANILTFHRICVCRKRVKERASERNEPLDKKRQPHGGP